jgi:hypothetical protein
VTSHQLEFGVDTDRSTDVGKYLYELLAGLLGTEGSACHQSPVGLVHCFKALMSASAPYGTSTSLPVVSRLSSARCASAAPIKG